MHVIEGEFEFTLDGKTKVCHQGDIVPIVSNLSQSGKALIPCKVMDVFSLARGE